MPLINIFKRDDKSRGCAALSAFKTSLGILAKAPIPGVEVATETLLVVIAKAEDMSEGKRLCNGLAERVHRLWYLAREISRVDPQLCDPLARELDSLAEDIEDALKPGKLKAFFMGTDNVLSFEKHRKNLDSIIIDLTATLAVLTHRTTSSIHTMCAESLAVQYGLTSDFKARHASLAIQDPSNALHWDGNISAM
ncbi:hypothetical protein C8J56DRAFT_922509 [Mycena floridula]|nr:hypothetical protein C8J56DRAFT_922509 [Mycena floridula]